MRWVKAIAAGLAMVVVIVGAPVLLITWGSLGEGWWRADDGSLLLALLTIAGWLAWLAFTLATVLEIVRQTSGHRFVPDLPLLGGLQALCAGLVLAVISVAAGSSEPSIESPRPGGSPRAASASVLVERPAVEVPIADVSPADGGDPAAASGQSEDGGSYAVAAGDDLWSVAERLLGKADAGVSLPGQTPICSPIRPLS